ncbi:hypothetical protein JR782_004915 [Salmonella enterica subsp. enterica serovar Eastbourne]|nr:hypothetical protein [Salmonella enterica subsp. enterica serovar Eastbourne]EHC5910459.1 hypothetical protein [Salmonella enterica subsp. enterica serovar Eastbourne]EJW4861880.1 hypothetical protein [Salmonella enterica]
MKATKKQVKKQKGKLSSRLPEQMQIADQVSMPVRVRIERGNTHSIIINWQKFRQKARAERLQISLSKRRMFLAFSSVWRSHLKISKKSRKRGSAAAKDCSGLLLCNTVKANSSLVSDFPCVSVINKDFSLCK